MRLSIGALCIQAMTLPRPLVDEDSHRLAPLILGALEMTNVRQVKHAHRLLPAILLLLVRQEGSHQDLPRASFWKFKAWELSMMNFCILDRQLNISCWSVLLSVF